MTVHAKQTLEKPEENQKDLEDALKWLEIKEKGNDCIKDGNFKEAALYYTEAIKMDPENYSLYSNRSLAYLKLQHYYLALQDANETVRLQPLWAKGFFRRAEVESAVGLTEEAVLSYTRALQLQPHDLQIIDAIKRVSYARKRKKEGDEKIPWICSCIGLIIGVFLVILDYILVEREKAMNPLMQVAFSLTLAGGGLSIGKGFIWLENRNIENSLMPPDTEEQAADKLPWKCRWIGLAAGTTIVFVDCTVTGLLGLKNPVTQVAFALAIAVGGWSVGTVMRHQKISETNPPPEISEEEAVEENPVPERTSNKYTKAQARYRYKKGKM